MSARRRKISDRMTLRIQARMVSWFILLSGAFPGLAVAQNCEAASSSRWEVPDTATMSLEISNQGVSVKISGWYPSDSLGMCVYKIARAIINSVRRKLPVELRDKTFQLKFFGTYGSKRVGRDLVFFPNQLVAGDSSPPLDFRTIFEH